MTSEAAKERAWQRVCNLYATRDRSGTLVIKAHLQDVFNIGFNAGYEAARPAPADGDHSMKHEPTATELLEGAATALSGQWSEAWIARLRSLVVIAEADNDDYNKIVTLLLKEADRYCELDGNASGSDVLRALIAERDASNEQVRIFLEAAPADEAVQKIVDRLFTTALGNRADSLVFYRNGEHLGTWWDREGIATALCTLTAAVSDEKETK